jgi:predicted nucleic acid-binding protein
MLAVRAYFDTSVLAKRYLNETGSLDARRLLREYRCVTSVLTPVELASALTRRRIMGELNERVVGAIMRRASADRSQWELVAVTEPLLRGAEEVIRSTGLKALDGLQIASALFFQDRSIARIPFISPDERQLNAAAACGLRTERGR